MNSLKNNDSNPIDELFQRKLVNHTLEPSAEAREKFLAQINKRKVRPIWYFSAAASVLMLCGLGWFLYANSNNGIMPTELAEAAISPTSKEVLAEKPKTTLPIIETEKAPETPQLANVPKTRIKTPLVVKTKEVSKKSNTLLAETESINEPISETPQRSITGVLEMDEPIQDALTLALQQSEKRKSLAEKKEKPKNTDFFQKGVGETIIIVTSDIPKEEILVPGINPDSPMTLAEATEIGNTIRENDRSLIAKVFTELKHLKHGEKVDLNSLTASNTTSQKDETFFNHETEQLRQRFRWLKGKVTTE